MHRPSSFLLFECVRLSIRERKGYGKKNLEEGLKSDAEGGLPRFERNQDLREVVTSNMEDISMVRLFQLMEFVEEKIRTPLVEITNRFLEARQTPDEVPSSLQWIAMARIQWFGKLISKKLEHLRKHAKQKLKGLRCFSMLLQCEEWARSMRWESFGKFLALGRDITDADGNNVYDAVRCEISEQMWYDLMEELPSPYDGSMWCPIALSLVDRLSEGIASCTWTGRPSQQLLEEIIFTAAKDATEQVRKAAQNPLISLSGLEAAHNSLISLSGLEFESGVKVGSFVCANQVSFLHKKLMQSNSSNPKGLVAALFEFSAYFDCAYLLDDHCLADTFSLPLQRDDLFLMTKFDGLPDDWPLTSIPKSVENCQKMSAVVNETWYILWQVVFIANAVAQHYVGKQGGYNLQQLCDQVGVDAELAKNVVEQGISRRTLMEQLGTVTSKKRKRGRGGRPPLSLPKKTTIKATKSAENSASRQPAQEIWSGPPDEELPGGWPRGWTKKVFERASGASKGHRDRYWFTPQKQYKLRSIIGVRKFLGYLRTVGNDEDLAWQMFRKGPGRA